MILSIDIGGTSAKMGLVTRQGEITARREVPVAFDGYRTPILESVCRGAEAFARETSAEIEGVGVSATGQIDDRQGVVIGTNGKIPGYENSNIRQAMEQLFRRPAAVLNDANAAVLGEAFLGRAKGLRHVVMLTLGTGVGGGVIVDGRLLSGRRGIAGELGHMVIAMNGRACACGSSGCLENYAATTALVRLAKEKTGESELDGRTIFARAAQNDPAMLSALDEWLDAITAGVTGLVHLFNPEMVLIGGGVSAQEQLLMQPLRSRVLSRVMPRFAEGLQIERAALGNDAGMIGAAKWWMDCCGA